MQLVIQSTQQLTQAVLLDQGIPVEYVTQQSSEIQRTGSIFKGRVVHILPGMQAAFVDIGLEKNAFLYIDDVLPESFGKKKDVKPSIEEVLKPEQTLLVQVIKEPEGRKGAKVTTHFSLPGRWIVYLPYAGYVAVSRKIACEDERTRLKQIAETFSQGEEGFIIRTVAEGRKEEEIWQEIRDLRLLWSDILQDAGRVEAPAEVYQSADLLPRLVRDYLNKDIEEIWVDSYSVQAELLKLLACQEPEMMNRIYLYQNTESSLFEHKGILERMDRFFRRKVWLPSGGYVVMDFTEALTVIDVNTGKYTGTTNLEETVYQTNKEAAELIPRLLRLRNIRGIVIVDFIDMEQESHKEAVLGIMKKEALKDYSRTNIVGWTRLGMLELTRKRK